MIDRFKASVDALEDADRVRNSRPLPDPVASAAAAIGAAGEAAAHAHVLNTALKRLIDLCYQDDGAGLCNIDRATGKLHHLLPVPWSSVNYGKYSLGSRQRADVLSLIMRAHMNQTRKPLFIYHNRRWYVNLRIYPSREDALRWLSENQISGQMWREWREALTKSKPATKGGAK